MTSAGEQLRLDGQDAALAAATVGHHDHPNRIETALTELIRSGREFSADDVREALPPETQAWLKLKSIGPNGKVRTNGNVLSSLIGAHSALNHITFTGRWEKPRRKERHANPNRVWKGAA